MLRILLSYNRLFDALKEYESIQNALDSWGGRISTVDRATFSANNGLFANMLHEKNRVFIKSDLSSLITQNKSMYDTLIWTEEWSRGLLNRVDEFASILETGADALQSYEYMACSLGTTELLIFEDENCPQDNYFEGDIQLNTEMVVENSANEIDDLDEIQALIMKLKSCSVDISSESENIRTCADRQERVEKVFASLKVYGTGVQILNDHVRIEFSKYPYFSYLRMHNRSFNYEGDQKDSTGYVYIMLLKEDGLSNEDIEKARSTSHLTPAELYKKWSKLETQEDKEFCLSIIHGNYSVAFGNDSRYISDAAIGFAASYQAGMIQIDENGKFIGNMEEFEKMNNAMLNGYSYIDRNQYVEKAAAAAMVETNNAAIAATGFYGSDVYTVLYENYAKWQAVTAFYTMEDNEIRLNLGNNVGSAIFAEAGILDKYNVSNMNYVYDSKTGTGSFIFDWDYGRSSIHVDSDGSLMHDTKVKVSIYETQVDIQNNNGGNVVITKALEKAQKDREKAAIKMVKDATVGIASAYSAPVGIAMDFGFNMIQDEGDYSSADSINAYAKALKAAGYDGNIKDVAGYITGQVADARNISTDTKGYCVSAVKTTIAVASDIYAMYDLEKQIGKDLDKAQNEVKMDWFGSAFGYSVSDTGNRDYFFYMDDVVNPTVATKLSVAKQQGLNKALGWSRNETNQVMNAIRDLDAISEEQKSRMLGYFNANGYGGNASNSGYIGYDYLNLDSNPRFEQGYGNFNDDMKAINGICESIFADGYDISTALR